MRIERCRKCGKGLEIKQKCDICKEAIKFGCTQCSFESEEQIHSICRLVDFNQKRLVVKVA